jgi:hypothetical protein
MMVRPHLTNLVLLLSRRWVAAMIACAIVTGPGFRSVALADGSVARGTQSAIKQDDGLAFVLRPGDVLVDSALGVLRTPSASVTDLLFVSPQLGVLRTPAPIVLPPAPLISPTLGVLRGPAIFGANPAVLDLGQNGQLLSIEGRGLLGAESVVFEPSADTVVAGFTVDPSGERIDAIVDIAQGAAPGIRRLRVMDSLGNPIPEVRPGDSQILLRSGLPKITSVSPNLLSTGNVYSLEIRGANLRGLPSQNGPTFDEQPTVTISPSTGIAVAGSALSNDAGTRVVVSLAVDADAALIDRLIQVETSSGISSATPTPANVIHLADAPLRLLTPFASPQLGVTRHSRPHLPHPGIPCIW